MSKATSQAAGVTLYPEAQHVNDAGECERWFYAGNAQGLIREYVQRAIPAGHAQLVGILSGRGCGRPRRLCLAQELLRRRGVSGGNSRSVPAHQAKSCWLHCLAHLKRFRCGPGATIK